ncbi:uncharacterized protein LOC126899314 [Daktulosphaira vitifoliae]|uniref:uncharacterized protein LOC126899314 n=1 Tax=Daktulosphaira vitifoliae TaxID=58002 RepID=UPI0021AAA37B|nr:uncharacterized protein LOC126899314 [Daktulosphaira vitifoliae]XP_050530056.1 uncharacterized protein LOC126899314 [Daktulosphaira vitifoliae]
MDQESGIGRRRSSRLAAKGVVATPKPEIIKKTPKTTDKSKRQKRKQSEERPSPIAKKSKTDDHTVDENDSDIDNEISNNVETESDQVDTVAVTTIPKKDEETPIVITGTSDPKKVIIDNASIDSEEQEKMDVELPSENKDEVELTKQELLKEDSIHSQVEKIEEESVKIGEVNNFENGLPAKDIDLHSDNNEKGSNGVSNSSSNGTTDADSKQTNGAESITKSAVEENKKILCEGKNHLTESEINNCSTILNNSNNDTTEQEKIESNSKAIEKSVGNATMSSEGIASNVDKPSTIVS